MGARLGLTQGPGAGSAACLLMQDGCMVAVQCVWRFYISFYISFLLYLFSLLLADAIFNMCALRRILSHGIGRTLVTPKATPLTPPRPNSLAHADYEQSNSLAPADDETTFFTRQNKPPNRRQNNPPNNRSVDMAGYYILCV